MDYEKAEDLRLETLELQAASLRYFESNRIQRERDEEHERALRTGYFQRQAELNSPATKRESLRDQFALSAMNALLYAAPDMAPRVVSLKAWALADALLEARPK